MRRLLPLLALVACSQPQTAVEERRWPGHVVDIVATEYVFHAPDSVPAGVVTLRLTQAGDATKPWPGDTARRVADPTYDFHMAWLVRLDSAKTVSDLYRAERDSLPTPWATTVGGVGFAPSDTANATLLLEPGSYALVCFVGSAREDRTRYHLLKGMIRPLEVTATAAADELPAADVTIELRGDSIVLLDSLTAGRHRILVRNLGERPADLGVNRLQRGSTLEQVDQWRPRMMDPPPTESLGGVVAVPPGGSLLTTIDLEPGEYLLNGREGLHVVVN